MIGTSAREHRRLRPTIGILAGFSEGGPASSVPLSDHALFGNSSPGCAKNCVARKVELDPPFIKRLGNRGRFPGKDEPFTNLCR